MALSRRIVDILLFTALALTSRIASAQTLYWDTNGSALGTSATSTANWNGTSDWTTDSTGSSTTTTYVSGDDVVFSAGSNGTGAQNVTVNGTVATNGITIDNGLLTLSGSSTPSLSVGADGVTIDSDDGATNFASSLGTITLSASQDWANDSTQNFTDASGITGTSVTLTFNGTGSGTSTLSGAIGGSTSIVQNSATSSLALTHANTFTGSTTVSAGTLLASSDTAVGSDGNTIDLSGGGILTFSSAVTFNHNVVATGTGGTLNFAGDSVLEGSYSATTLTLGSGDDLIATSGNQSIGTLDLVGNGTINTNNRMILGISNSGGNGFINGSTINVSNAYTFDFGSGGTYANVINLASTTALENRGGTTVLSGVVLPTSGTLTLGSDDVGGGSITISDGVVLNGPLTLDINGHSGNSDSTPVYLTGAIGGSGTLSLNPGPSSGSYLYLKGANTYSGSTTINNLTVAPTGSAFGSSVVTLNSATLQLQNGDYNGTDNPNEFILGTGTNLINGASSITSFSGYVVNGAGSVLHLTGSNNTIDPAAGAVSDYSTLDIDSGRTFLMQHGLNFIAAGANNGNSGTAVNVAANTTLDFDVGSTFTSNNAYTFASTSGLTLRDDYGTTNATLTDVTLPTSGTFTMGSDDEGNEKGSITINSALALAGNLTIYANDSGGSTVVSALHGNISGTGGLSASAGANGAGILDLSGTNSYSGSTTVNAGLLDILGSNVGAGSGYQVNGGTLQIGTGGSISTSATVSLAAASATAPAVFELGDASGAVSQTVSSISATGTTTSDSIVGGASGTSTLTVNNATADTFAGKIGGAGTNQNLIALAKTGAGTLTLSGTNTYTGGTTVSGGKLVVDGLIAGNVAVGLGAQLGGQGQIAGTISGAGAVGPGDSPGILTASAVNGTSATSFDFEFTLAGSPTYGSASASENDVLHLEGGTPFTAALTAGNVINLYFSQVGSGFEGGFFINGADQLTAALANATFDYYVADPTGAVLYNGNHYDLTTGTESVVAAANAAFADGAASGYTEEFSVAAVPEPSTSALLLLGGAGLLVLGVRTSRRPLERIRLSC